MKFIQNIVEPEKLFLSWQPPVGQDRQRFIVAHLLRDDEDARLVYLRESDEFARAKTKGFEGEYPGFPGADDHDGVLAAFMRRLPPRSRNDFDDFLTAIRIQPGAAISDFALLGYAGGKLPGDDFYIIHPFDNAEPPFEFLIPVSGYRHYQGAVPYDAIELDTPARFECEPENQHDPNAVRIVLPDIADATAGYVHRGLVSQLRGWLEAGLSVEGTVERKNGTGEHRQVYLFVTVRASSG